MRATMLIVAAALAVFACQPAAAETVSIACTWEKWDAPAGASALERAGEEAGKFYQTGGRPLIIVFDTDAVVVSFVNAIDQQIMRRNVSSLRETRLEVTIRDPDIRGLVQLQSELVVEVNRFDLSSILTLSAGPGAGELTTVWTRAGTCLTRQF